MLVVPYVLPICVGILCRPVDCATNQTLAPYLPGPVSKTIFSNQLGLGWGLSSYPDNIAQPGPNEILPVDQELQTNRLSSPDQGGLDPVDRNGSCFTFPSGKLYSVSFQLFFPVCSVSVSLQACTSFLSFSFLFVFLGYALAKCVAAPEPVL